MSPFYKEVESVPALIFIPDMSGFTDFVAHNDLRINKLVIPPLLKSMITANILNLEMAEIQGDAVLFYRIGTPPTINEILEQAQQVFLHFEKRLEEIEVEISKRVEGYTSPSNLGLKVIVHYGEIGMANISGFTKLLGEDVIIAHKLLKNSIPSDEYLLMSDGYLHCFDEKALQNFPSLNIRDAQDSYPHLGVINYKYIVYEYLKDFAGTKTK